MPEQNPILVYRMTHIQNVPHILKNGITHISSAKKNKKYVPIGDGSLISTRSTFIMPNDRRLGDYTPFYFGPRMPMLFVIQRGFNGVTPVRPQEVVYCISSVKSIKATGLDFVFTDGHAVDRFSEFYYRKDLKKIDTLIDMEAVASKYWKDDNDLDLKRRMEAEFLVEGDIPVQAIESFAVYDAHVAQQIKQMIGYRNQAVIIQPNYYF